MDSDEKEVGNTANVAAPEKEEVKDEEEVKEEESKEGEDKDEEETD